MTCPGPLSPYFPLTSSMLMESVVNSTPALTVQSPGPPWTHIPGGCPFGQWQPQTLSTARRALPRRPYCHVSLSSASLLCPYCHQTGPWHLLSGRWRQPLARLPATSVDCRGLLTNPSNMLLGLHHSWAQNPCIVSSHIQNKVQIPLQNF